MTTTSATPVLCQRFTVVGMTCSHCEHAVSESVDRIDGVVRATADARAATVTIEAIREIDPDVVALAVEDAGYELAR